MEENQTPATDAGSQNTPPAMSDGANTQQPPAQSAPATQNNTNAGQPNTPAFADAINKAAGQGDTTQPPADDFAQWLDKMPSEMTAEQSASFWQKMGRPETADGYELPKEDKLNFKDIAFSNNLSKTQAKAIYEKISNAGLEVLKQQQNADKKQMLETEKYLRDTYADKYDEKIVLMQKGIETFGGAKMLEKLKRSGLMFDRDIVQQYITIGEMVSESGSFTRGANGGNTGYISPLDGGLMKF